MSKKKGSITNLPPLPHPLMHLPPFTPNNMPIPQRRRLPRDSIQRLHPRRRPLDKRGRMRILARVWLCHCKRTRDRWFLNSRNSIISCSGSPSGKGGFSACSCLPHEASVFPGLGVGSGFWVRVRGAGGVGGVSGS
jgi:hypothetical protein